MANGYCPALLRSIEQIAGENAPSRKLHVAGFLAMTFCCQNSTVNPINDGFNNSTGTRRPLTVSYTQRPTLSQVQDEDDCDINNIPTKSEWSFPSMRHKQYSFFLADSEVNQYCEEFSQNVNVGPTQMMREHYDRFLEGANIVLRAINNDLVTLASTQFGANVTNNGQTSAKPINIPQTPNLVLNTGAVELFRDFQENEICGEPCIVGGGLFSGFNIAQQFACCSSGGVDISKIGMPRFFFDKDSQSVWGTNQIGVFAPGSVKFISRMKYVGNYAGVKGTSVFFTIGLPVGEFGCAPDCLNDLRFDVQMKYIDCPTSITVNGTAQTVNRGWQVIISKEYSLWVMPTTAYRLFDPLYQTNGTLRYLITNTA